MIRSFEKALDFLWKWEGYVSDDKDDPGGYTKYGITAVALQEARLDLNGDGKIDKEDVKHVTPDIAAMVYKNNYWDTIGGDDLPWDLALAAFDTAVNVGPYRVKEWLKTHNTVASLLERRMVYYGDIIAKRPALGKFRRGWANRVNDLKKYIEVLRADAA